MEEASTHTVIVIFCKQPWIQFVTLFMASFCCPPVFLPSFRKRNYEDQMVLKLKVNLTCLKISQSLIDFPADSIGFLLLCVAAQLLPPRKARQGKSG